MKLIVVLTVASLMLTLTEGSMILQKWIDAANAYTDPAVWARVAVYSVFGWLMPVLGGAIKVMSIDLYAKLKTFD